MSAREYLSETFKMRSRMIALKRREEELRTEAEGLRAIVYDKDKVQTSVTNKFDAIMADLVSVQLEYGRAMEECMRALAIREKQIAALPVQYADVLRWRYLECDEAGKQLKFDVIRIKMHMEHSSSARKLHARAINAFECMYEMGTQCHATV